MSGGSMDKQPDDYVESPYEQYQACRALWGMVIIQALQDATEAVGRSRNMDRAVKREMGYFRSKSFQKVCALAEIDISPKLIKAELRSLRNWKNKYWRKDAKKFLRTRKIKNRTKKQNRAGI